MTRFLLFMAAATVLFWGGFVYDEVGPIVYAVVLAIFASIPLLITTTFWKKILLMIPLLVLKVAGKVMLIIFGKNAFSKALAKYGLLEKRFNQTVSNLNKSKEKLLLKWRALPRSYQAYLVLIFFPVAILIVLIALVIEFIRLRFLRFAIEKVVQRVMMKWTVNRKNAKNDSAKNDVDSVVREAELDAQAMHISEAHAVEVQDEKVSIEDARDSKALKQCKDKASVAQSTSEPKTPKTPRP